MNYQSVYYIMCVYVSMHAGTRNNVLNMQHLSTPTVFFLCYVRYQAKTHTSYSIQYEII